MRRRGRRRIPDPAIGVLVLLAVAAISYLAFHKGLPFVRGYQVHAMFRDANQIRPGSPVRIAGVDVGKVKKLDNGPGNTTDVTLDVQDSARPLHTDATLRVRPRLFLEGGFYVALSPGTPGAPEIPDDGTIPITQTAAPVQFAELLSTFDRPTRRSLRGIIAETATAFDGSAEDFRNATPQFAPLLRDVTAVARAARGSEPGDVPALIRSTARVTTTLAERDVQLGDLVGNLQRTAAALSSGDGALGQTLEQGDALLREAPPALTAVDRALPSLRRFTTAALPGIRIAPQALARVSTTLDQFGRLVAPGERERVVTALRTALQDLPVVLRRLGAVFPSAKPVTDCLTARVLPVLNSQLPDGALSSGDPAWKDFAHGLVGLSSIAQNFDGNGFAMRYLAGGGAETIATGSLPIIGTLLGSAPSGDPLLGSRPQWLGPGTLPPFRPDADCMAQPKVNLAAKTGPVGATVQSRTRPPKPTLDRQDIARWRARAQAGR